MAQERMTVRTSRTVIDNSRPVIRQEPLNSNGYVKNRFEMTNSRNVVTI